VPKHGVRYRSCTSEPAIPCVVTRDGPELYNRGEPLVNDHFWCSADRQTSLACVIGLGFAALSFISSHRRFRHQKNTPLRSRPNCAKSIFVIAEETNLKPCPVLFSVVTTT
jgi:hypothetical protein